MTFFYLNAENGENVLPLEPEDMTAVYKSFDYHKWWE